MFAISPAHIFPNMFEYVFRKWAFGVRRPHISAISPAHVEVIFSYIFVRGAFGIRRPHIFAISPDKSCIRAVAAVLWAPAGRTEADFEFRRF